MAAASDRPTTTPVRVPGSLWGIQALILAALGAISALWVLLVPVMIDLPLDLAAQVRGYTVYLIPVALLVVVNHLWLAPVVARFQALVAGELEPERTVRLLGRLTGYPYLAFGLTLLGVVLVAGLVSWFHSQVHATPIWRVIELLVLAVALAVVAALLVFAVCRLAVAPFMGIPGASFPRARLKPGLRSRLTLAVGSVAFVTWSFAAVLVVDRLQCQTAGAGAASLDPSVARAAFWLALAGVGFVLLAVLGAVVAARDLATEPSSIAEGLGILASQTEAAGKPGQRAKSGWGPIPCLPVVCADEFGDLAAAFNRLAVRLAERADELRVRAELAREAERRQVDFLSSVSVDLRTPLHSINGFTQILLEGLDGELTPDQAEDVQTILKSGHHLLSLVDDLVDLSRIDTGHLALNVSEVDLGEVIAEALDAASGLRRDRPIELVAEVPKDLPRVRADQTRLRQILFNLLGNAIKFSEAGRVTVDVSRSGSAEVLVAVRDSGPGLPPESLDRVFEEFEQLHQANRPRGPRGTGLGLAITRRLVELHGGTIQARNCAGGGAELSFSLPLTAAHEVGT